MNLAQAGEQVAAIDGPTGAVDVIGAGSEIEGRAHRDDCAQTRMTVGGETQRGVAPERESHDRDALEAGDLAARDCGAEIVDQPGVVDVLPGSVGAAEVDAQ